VVFTALSHPGLAVRPLSCERDHTATFGHPHQKKGNTSGVAICLELLSCNSFCCKTQPGVFLQQKLLQDHQEEFSATGSEREEAFAIGTMTWALIVRITLQA
jgi:hypothetical protein